MENRKLRERIGRDYLDRIRKIVENEENSVAFIERRNLMFSDMIEILKNGRLR